MQTTYQTQTIAGLIKTDTSKVSVVSNQIVVTSDLGVGTLHNITKTLHNDYELYTFYALLNDINVQETLPLYITKPTVLVIDGSIKKNHMALEAKIDSLAYDKGANLTIIRFN